MVLKLYGWLPSPYVQSVMIVLHEKHVPFEFINVELPKGEHKKPEYSDVHPFTQVPVIVNTVWQIYLFSCSQIFDFLNDRMTMDSSCMKVVLFANTSRRSTPIKVLSSIP